MGISDAELYDLDLSNPRAEFEFGSDNFRITVANHAGLLRRDRLRPRYIRTVAKAPFKSPYDAGDNPSGKPRPYFRAEVGGTAIRRERELWLAFDFRGIDLSHARNALKPDGSPNRLCQAMICQMKMSPDESGIPAFFLSHHPDRLRVVVGGNDNVDAPNPHHDRTTFYLPPLKQGVGYSFIARVKRGHTGDGELDLWIDGRLALSKRDLTIGYPTTRRVWEKFGLYNADTIEYMEVEHANMICAPDLSHLLEQPPTNPFR